MSQHSSPDDDVYDVTECECGHLTLRLGRLRIDLSREEFVQLRHAIARASARLNTALAPPTGRVVMH